MNGFYPSLIDKRTHIDLRIEAITNFEFFGGCHQALSEFPLYSFMDNHPTGRGTPLTGGTEASPGNTLDSKVQVGIFQHNHGIFAAQFQGAAAQVAPANLGYMPSNLGRAGQ